MTSPRAAAAGSSWPRRPEVQGLRAVAVLAVVAFHAGVPLDGGFLGVDVFFVISGWALGGVLVTTASATGRVDVGDFFARRSRRLLPLLSLVIGTVLVMHVLTSNPYVPEQVVPRTALAGLTFSANFYLYRNTGYFDVEADVHNPLLHLWSLSVEEQIYLVLPFMVIGGLALCRVFSQRFRRAPRASAAGPAAVLAAATAISFALAALMVTGAFDSLLEAPVRFAFYSPFSRLWEVGVGALVAIVPKLFPQRPRPSRAVAAIGALLGALLVLTSFVLVGASGGVPVPAAVPAVLGTALLLGTAPYSTPMSAALSWAPLLWIGDRSYGWYLWHWPAMVLSRRLIPDAAWPPLVAGGLSLGLAAITYRLVEQRFRHQQRWVGRRAVVRSLRVLAVPALLAVIAGTGHRHGWGLSEPTGWYETPIGTQSGCLIVNRDLPNLWDPDRCMSGGDEADGLVLVLGDAAISSVTPAVTDDAERRGWAAAEWGRSGCPFLSTPVADYPGCARWQDAAWGLVAELDPDLVVIANRSLDYVDPSSGPHLEGAEDSDSSALVWRLAVERTVGRLAEMGIPVVVVGPVPDYGSQFPRSRLWPIRPHPGTPVLDRSAVDRQRSEVVRAERSVVDPRPTSSYLDPVPELCSEVCSPVADGLWLYSDAHHLSTRGSRLLGDALASAADGVIGTTR